MTKPAVVVENLSKVYRIGRAERRHDTLVGALAASLSAPVRNFRDLYRLGTAGRDGDAPDTIRAVDGVSFEVQPGEVLGIIGRNGAGKSTLLKMLSRITRPTSGRIRMRGRVSSLLEVGTGFHPELTGRENVYLNGTILGMTKREIDLKFDEIVDFSGVEKFLDTPVKRYSSGMKVRLAFAVAAHLEPEILIVDEVLAVGDYEFQKKCLGKMEEVTRGGGGRTVLFVSHNMGMMRSLCSHCLCLQQGRLAFEGQVEECVDFYEAAARVLNADGIFRAEEDEGLPWQVLEVELLDGSGRRATVVDQFEPLRVRVVYRIRTPLVGHNLALSLDYNGDLLFASFDTDLAPERLERRDPGLYEATIELPTELLKAGSYSINLGAGVVNGRHVAGRVALPDVVGFDVREVSSSSLKSYAPKRRGRIAIRLPWNIRVLQFKVTQTL